MTRTSLTHILFGFEGRLRRLHWWLFGILVVLIQVGVMLSGHVLLFGMDEPPLGTFRLDPTGIYISPSWWVTNALGAVTLWPQLALAVKRGHDIGWSAAWTMGLYLLGFAFNLTPTDFGPILGGQDMARPESFVGPGLFILSTLLNLFLFVALGLIDGKPDPNRYGPSPKAKPGASAA